MMALRRHAVSPQRSAISSAQRSRAQMRCPGPKADRRLRTAVTRVSAALALLTGVARAAVDDPFAGLIIDEADLARDAQGRVAAAAIPGVRARRPLDQAIELRLEELTERRDAVGVGSAAGADAVVLPLPDAADAPPRIDSGTANPDRLNSAPPPAH